MAPTPSRTDGGLYIIINVVSGDDKREARHMLIVAARAQLSQTHVKSSKMARAMLTCCTACDGAECRNTNDECVIGERARF